MAEKRSAPQTVLQVEEAVDLKDEHKAAPTLCLRGLEKLFESASGRGLTVQGIRMEFIRTVDGRTPVLVVRSKALCTVGPSLVTEGAA